MIRYRNDLFRHGIQSLETTQLPDVELKLPALKGNNIEEHFFNIAQEQVDPYKKLITSLVASNIPEMPKVIKLKF